MEQHDENILARTSRVRAFPDFLLRTPTRDLPPYGADVPGIHVPVRITYGLTLLRLNCHYGSGCEVSEINRDPHNKKLIRFGQKLD